MDTQTAAIVQTISTVVLVLIIAIYVGLTKRTMRASAKSQEEERARRQTVVNEAIGRELLDIIRCCPNPGKSASPVLFPTYVWDTMKGELATLGNPINTALSELYTEVRRCNAEYAKHIYAARNASEEETEHYYNWNTAALRLIRLTKTTHHKLIEVIGSKD
ncbi:MAG: hypothetical protein MI923_10360 [Phycisphaerales bacterium]|nr:hypothetical protein [Phycisphaerales bacterium]